MAGSSNPDEIETSRVKLDGLNLGRMALARHGLDDLQDDLESASASTSGSESSSSSVISTRSLREEDLTTVEENGRIYPDDDYFMPSDDQEATRLSIVHRIYTAALGGDLTTAPLSHEGTSNPTGAGLNILDVGTGPGDWAVAAQTRWPDAEVVAVDVGVWPDYDSEPSEAEDASPSSSRPRSHSHPTRPSPKDSVFWEIDNLDAHPPDWTPASNTPLLPLAAHAPPQPPLATLANPWTFTTRFDLIHIRGMKGSFRHWPSIYRSAYAALAPGGWLEVSDYEFDREEVVEDTFTPDRTHSGSSLLDLFQALRATMRALGRPLDMAHMQPAILEAAGFVDVWTKVVDIPVGGSSGSESSTKGKARARDPPPPAAAAAVDDRQRVAGKLWLVGIMDACEAMTLRPLTRHAAWSRDRVLHACEAARAELKAGMLEGVRTPFQFVRARKPFGEDDADE